MKGYYYSFSEYLRARYGVRVQRLSLNAGFSCPNRDGTLDQGGCIFCNAEGFAGFTDTRLSLEEQINTSLSACRRRFKAVKFLAYFQNASNTYAPVKRLKETYDVIRKFPEIVGLFISTRPDCIDEEKLDLIASYAGDYEVWIEYGLQSVHNATLKKINRRHDYACFADAVQRTGKRKINVAAHVILGLPGESSREMNRTAKTLADIGVQGVKVHLLHVLRETKLAELYSRGEINLMSETEYVHTVCDFLEELDPGCVIMRLVSNARSDVLIAPQWLNNKAELLKKIEDEFRRRGTYQGWRRIDKISS